MSALVLLSGLACACLVRYAPGALVDERELNQRAGEDTLAALREHKAQQRERRREFRPLPARFGAWRPGFSESNNSPVSALLADRAPRTLRDLSLGLAAAWLFGLGLAILARRFSEVRPVDATLTLVSGLLLSLPAALIAYFCLLAEQRSFSPRSGHRAGAENLSILAQYSDRRLRRTARRDGESARNIGNRDPEDRRAALGRTAIGRTGSGLRQPRDRRCDSD